MDPQRLSLARDTRLPQPKSRARAPRHRSGERFLRGPIPWTWLARAAQVSGQGAGLKVALVLWFLSGLKHQAKTVALSGKLLRELGVERHAAYRGLAVLEQEGLVSVVRQPGRSPVVTLQAVGEPGGD